MAEGARLESVCGGNSTAGSNPALSAIRSQPGAHPGARALCIVTLRTVSDPEGSSTKEDFGECRRSPGFHGGLPFKCEDPFVKDELVLTFEVGDNPESASPPPKPRSDERHLDGVW